MPETTEPDRCQTSVLVTGASGFIGLHCVRELLEQGYRVRGTVRSLDRAAGLRDTLAEHAEIRDRLEFVSAELTADTGWDDAVAGCRYVLHVASPLPRALPRREDEIIVPARDGTLRVLRAASRAGIERVVLTSSIAAVTAGHKGDTTRVYDENDWSRLEGIAPYEKSKTIAERAAWEFVDNLPQDRKLELATINPGLVLGPSLGANASASTEAVAKLMRREFPGCPRLGWPLVDVRDVASAHVSAMTTPEAAGQRFCCVTEFLWMTEIATILNHHFGKRGYKVATRQLPDFLVRLVALYDKPTRTVLDGLGKRTDVSNERIKRLLDWKPRSAEEMIVALGESLIEHGAV